MEVATRQKQAHETKLRSRLDREQVIRLRVRFALDWRKRYGKWPTQTQLDRIIPLATWCVVR